MLPRPWRILSLVTALTLGLLLTQGLVAHPVHAGSSDDGSDEITNGASGAQIAIPSANQCQNGPHPLYAIPQVPLPQGGLSMTTDSRCYSIGDNINICYSVPGYGQVTLYDTINGNTHIVQTWTDDGTGDCGYPQAYAAGPAGSHCLRLRYYYANGSRSSVRTCFNVR